MSERKEIFLKDYTTPNFWIKHVDLTFHHKTEATQVKSVLKIVKNPEHASNELKLNGVNLSLKSIKIDDESLSSDEYKYENDYLTLNCEKAEFHLETIVDIDPDKNHSCEGLYKSGDIYCTQNEAQGFRKITFFLDRPDVMATFKTTIIANKEKFPFILANGNLVSQNDIENGEHKAIWEDPHPKPCYLFAVVFGDLALIKDSYTTKSGKEVLLELFVDHGNEDKTAHAMKSLINSMKWDEEKYGLEYDLERYMIVAVDSFNMGAMENKGLNIFNSHYVLAKAQTATDLDFKNIEAVIGHEYFHNWTGNRVTCRDWFQLTLKEGLTVFRDQEFSADMGSRMVKRIEDIKTLKAHQYPEDAGPLSHPIKPKSYIEINNFYTATVYEKGAEVIRMIQTLIGPQNFRKGMDLYFERHDGQAVTTEDFVGAMADASGYNLDHFKVWYDQNGTPKININTSYDADKKTFTIKLAQTCSLNNENFNSLYIPFKYSLIGEDGNLLSLENGGDIIFDQAQMEIIHANIPSKPLAIWNNEFSAPVNINYDYQTEDMYMLMKSSIDEYNRYNITQELFVQMIANLVKQLQENNELKVEEKFIVGLKTILTDNSIDNEFKSLLLSAPSEKVLFDTYKEYSFEHVRAARNFLVKNIGIELNEELTNFVQRVENKDEFIIDSKHIGERALKGVCLNYLACSLIPSSLDLVFSNFENAKNMTDEISTFNALINVESPYYQKTIDTFYDKWKDTTLVIQKWFSSLAKSQNMDIDKLIKLEEVPEFDIKVPNLVRSLYGSFLHYNIYHLNNTQTDVYKKITDKIIEIDKFNSSLAAGMTKRFNFKKKIDKDRQELLEKELLRIKNTKGISNDTFEIAQKNLS